MSCKQPTHTPYRIGTTSVFLRQCPSWVRVLVAGPTGVGKTTLIQTVLGAEVGTVGEGPPQTPGVEWRGTLPVWFADSKGLEIVKD
jgi:predicted GTPase